MIWSRLKSNKCPSCNHVLKNGLEMHECFNCDFKISAARFEAIILNQKREQAATHYYPSRSAQDNMRGLNEL
jgi:hypothetical protein